MNKNKYKRLESDKILEWVSLLVSPRVDTLNFFAEIASSEAAKCLELSNEMNIYYDMKVYFLFNIFIDESFCIEFPTSKFVFFKLLTDNQQVDTFSILFHYGTCLFLNTTIIL